MAARPGVDVVVSRLPHCDFCLYHDQITRPARYDFRTKRGPWANGCIAHYELYRAHADLGTGHGQRLMLPHELP